MDKRLERIEDGQIRLEEKLEEFIQSRAPIHVEFENRVTRLEGEIDNLELIQNKIDLIISSQLSIATQLTSHEHMHRANSASLDHHIARTDKLTELLEAYNKDLRDELAPIKKTHDFGWSVFRALSWLGGTIFAGYEFYTKLFKK